MLAEAAERFAPVFVEKDDEPDLVARYDVTYYPAFVWVDAAGEELWRSVQPADADELLEELAMAIEELDAGDE